MECLTPHTNWVFLVLIFGNRFLGWEMNKMVIIIFFGIPNKCPQIKQDKNLIPKLNWCGGWHNNGFCYNGLRPVSRNILNQVFIPHLPCIISQFEILVLIRCRWGIWRPKLSRATKVILRRVQDDTELVEASKRSFFISNFIQLIWPFRNLKADKEIFLPERWSKEIGPALIAEQK